jgi:hypothetical protein
MGVREHFGACAVFRARARVVLQVCVALIALATSLGTPMPQFNAAIPAGSDDSAAGGGDSAGGGAAGGGDGTVDCRPSQLG